MHPAFVCFEWGMLEVGRPHPEGHPVHSDSPWAHAVLSLRRTGKKIGGSVKHGTWLTGRPCAWMSVWPRRTAGTMTRG
jgi:hypothetical protein